MLHLATEVMQYSVLYAAQGNLVTAEPDWLQAYDMFKYGPISSKSAAQQGRDDGIVLPGSLNWDFPDRADGHLGITL